MTDVPLPSGEKNREVFGKAIKASSVITKSAMWSPIQNRHSVRLRLHVEKSTSNPVGCVGFAYYLCWAFKRRKINFPPPPPPFLEPGEFVRSRKPLSFKRKKLNLGSLNFDSACFKYPSEKTH